MKHLIAVPVAGNFTQFRDCLKSLVESDYDHDLVVLEDGIFPQDTTEGVCEELGVSRVKFHKPAFVSDMFDYLSTLCDDYDVVTISHSDTLYPPVWFGTLYKAWEDLIGYDKVMCINMNVVEVSGGHRWTNGVSRFELGWDRYNDMWKGMRQTGRSSPVISYSSYHFKRWDHAKVEYTALQELNYLLYMIDHRIWGMYLNTPLIKHYGGLDSRFNPAIGVPLGVQERNSYSKWVEFHGITISCTLWYWFSNILVDHLEEIVEAFNHYDFDSIDYIFDEFYVGWGNCDTCGIRNRCPWKYKNKDINNPEGR
jgi:hypothetical protein